ncbi:hypothetical protein BLA29_004372 [Euroglyphus maynei]|uniref:Uncharacterized protein n=1 Tax=Euroglyphus maynei TaxID=6958 RepID=A0A1Y3BFL7_EURMA|nr:hypothetical protein BLA29_004372 [Euroglyphus maynei]
MFAAKLNVQLQRIRIHDMQAIIPKHRIDLRNLIKLGNHSIMIATDSLIFTQSDGMKLGPITQVTLIAQIMAMEKKKMSVKATIIMG